MCQECSIGYEMQSQCTTEKDRNCTLCGDGKFRTENFVKCTPCTTCLPGRGETGECTPYSNRICSPCEKGTFSNDTSGVCRPCTPCAPGTEPLSYCEEARDYVCEVCGPGTFSDKGVVCSNCDRCPIASEASQPCTTTTNTTCKDCIEGVTYSERDPVTGLFVCVPCGECTGENFEIEPCTRFYNRRCSNITEEPEIKIPFDWVGWGINTSMFLGFGLVGGCLSVAIAWWYKKTLDTKEVVEKPKVRAPEKPKESEGGET